MLNKWIEKELKKCPVNLIKKSEYHYTTEFNGPLVPTVGHYYIIKLADYIIHPYEGFDLHDKWNKGLVPSCSYMEVGISEIRGGMIKVFGIGYDPETNEELVNEKWEGYLPRKSIDFVREVQ